VTKEVNSIEELKKAINSGEKEIISYNEDVVKKLKAVKIVKTWGPVAIGGIIVAVPIIIGTGGLAVPAVAAFAPAAATGATITATTIVALIVAIGGIIAISLFTDWEYVEIGKDGIKMKRKSGK
jgi:hypothetical protein